MERNVSTTLGHARIMYNVHACPSVRNCLFMCLVARLCGMCGLDHVYMIAKAKHEHRVSMLWLAAFECIYCVVLFKSCYVVEYLGCSLCTKST